MKDKKVVNKDNIKEFVNKYKTDKKYKAKVQLIGYGVFILIIIIGVNISAASSGYSGNITTMKRETNEPSTTTNQSANLLKEINNNYEYEVNAKITTKKDDKEETKDIKYTGKSYENNMEITKTFNNETNNYYKVDSRYYKKNNEQFELIKNEEIYDTIEKEYIELDSIKEYINNSTLDHVTEYSTGKKEYVYHMAVKTIIKSYPELDEIEIKILEENDILSIEIDYISLMKVIEKDFEECIVTYTYKNIGKVEEFTIINEQPDTKE